MVDSLSVAPAVLSHAERQQQEYALMQSENKMSNWQEIVEHFLRMSDPDDEYDRYAPSGASTETLAILEVELGCVLPSELREFYSHYDGLGLVPRDGSTEPLFVRPTHEVAGFIRECRLSFSETHPMYAQRYFPCVDWNNGDTSGFMKDADGKFLGGVYSFSHEDYLYDAEQDIDGFLFLQAESLAAFLNPD